jgi:hypothetical protein
MTNSAKRNSLPSCNPATTGLYCRVAATPARRAIATTTIDAPEIEIVDLVIVDRVIAVLVIAALATVDLATADLVTVDPSGVVRKDVAAKIVARPVGASEPVVLVAVEVVEVVGLTSARRVAIKAPDPSTIGSLA